VGESAEAGRKERETMRPKTMHTRSEAGNELRFELHPPHGPGGTPYFAAYSDGELVCSSFGAEARRDWRRAVTAVTK